MFLFAQAFYWAVLPKAENTDLGVFVHCQRDAASSATNVVQTEIQ
jgi:hypothetical protein